MKRIISLLLLLTLISSAYSTADKEAALTEIAEPLIIYVSPDGNDAWNGTSPDISAQNKQGPVQSIQKALELIRYHNGYQWHRLPAVSGRRQPSSPVLKRPDDITGIGGAAGPAVVCLREGTYTLDETVVITADESYPITFTSFPGENAVIDGGVQISDLKEETINGKTVWTANIPSVKSGKWDFRQLFVNGVRAQRARFPKKGWYVIEDPMASYDDLAKRVPQDRFKCKNGDIKAGWHNLNDIDMVMLSYWTEDRMPLKHVDPETNIVTTSVKSSFSMIDAHPFHGAGNARYWLENVFEALSEPGEWYLDKPAGKLYYMPLAGQTTSNTQVYAPRLKQFFHISGDKKDNFYTQNIRFKNITFRHAAYTWDKYRHTGNNYGNSEPGLIYFTYARYCGIEDCVFEHIGPYAIDLDQGCTRIRISGNRFTDMGAGAIKMYSVSYKEAQSGLTGVNLIADNEIISGGRAFPGSPAIVATRVSSTVFAHNHIADFYYNGITMGGGGYYEYAARENHVLNNYIHDIGQGWLSDMGGIYVHGIQPGTTISGNVIHDVNKAVYGAQCIYLDDAASHIIVENNLCYRTNDDIINIKGRENIIRNNIFAYGHEGLVRAAVGATGGRYLANVFHNILLSDGGAVYRGGYTMKLTKQDWICDANLIFCEDGSEPFCAQNVPVNSNEILTFEQWQNDVRQDRNSIKADPLFDDPQNGGFTLAEDSPAIEMGFNPLNFSIAGPRPKELRDKPIIIADESIKFQGHVD
jgi:hypothetical protein